MELRDASWPSLPLYQHLAVRNWHRPAGPGIAAPKPPDAGGDFTSRRYDVNRALREFRQGEVLPPRVRPGPAPRNGAAAGPARSKRPNGQQIRQVFTSLPGVFLFVVKF